MSGAAILILLVCLGLAGCAVPKQPQSVAHPIRQALPQRDPWCTPGPPLRLRCSALIEYHGKQLPLSVFMVITPPQQRVEAAVMTPLGLKLGTITLYQQDVIISQSLPGGFPARWFEMFALSLRRMILLPQLCDSNCSMLRTDGSSVDHDGNTSMAIRFNKSTDTAVTIEINSDYSHWELKIGGGEVSKNSFQEKRIVKDLETGFTLTLQMVQVETNE